MIIKTAQGRYRVKVKHRGVIVFDKTFTRRKDAESYENSKKSEVLNNGFIHPLQGRKTLSDIYGEWIDVRRSKVAIRTLNSDESAWRAHIQASIGNTPLSQITAGDIDAFAANVRRSTSGSTTNRVLATLKAMLDFAVRKKLIATNPAVDIRVKAKSSHQHVVVELPALVEIYAAQATKSKYADITLFLGLTGLRWGELAALLVQDVQATVHMGWAVNVSKNVVRVNGGGKPVAQDVPKGGKDRLVPLLPAALEIAKRWSEGKEPQELLFPSSNGGFLDSSNFRRAVKWSKTVPQGFRVHDLRHSAATTLLKANADVLGVQGILGHSESSTTLRYYGHVTGGEHLRSAMDKMGAALNDAMAELGGDSGASVHLLAQKD